MIAKAEPVLVECCLNCRFWVPTTGHLGHCHKNPPTATENMGSLWPTSMTSEWCGKFKFNEAKGVVAECKQP